jgi:hypothetical protein
LVCSTGTEHQLTRRRQETLCRAILIPAKLTVKHEMALRDEILMPVVTINLYFSIFRNVGAFFMRRDMRTFLDFEGEP